MTTSRQRILSVPAPFSFAQTCGPAAWVGSRSPHHQWSAGTLTSVEWEGENVVWRTASQRENGSLDITGSADPDLDPIWAGRVLGVDIHLPPFADPVMSGLANEFPGLHPMSDGSLFEGIITSIVGQSISVAAAAVTQTKLASRFCEPLELNGRNYWPLPTALQLAAAPLSLIRESGVTWKRAEAINPSRNTRSPENCQPMTTLVQTRKRWLRRSLRSRESAAGPRNPRFCGEWAPRMRIPPATLRFCAPPGPLTTSQNLRSRNWIGLRNIGNRHGPSPRDSFGPNSSVRPQTTR